MIFTDIIIFTGRVKMQIKVKIMEEIANSKFGDFQYA